MSNLIKTDRIRLRSWKDKDRKPFAKINADPAVMTYLGPALTRQKSDAAIDAQIALMKNANLPFGSLPQFTMILLSAASV